MKKILFLLLIILLAGCRLNSPVPVETSTPDTEAKLIKSYTDPITISWEYTPEDGVDYAFEFLMCDRDGPRTEANITVLGTVDAQQYGPFTLEELGVTDAVVFGVRSIEGAISSDAIWSDTIGDTEGGTFYGDSQGVWLCTSPAGIGIQ